MEKKLYRITESQMAKILEKTQLSENYSSDDSFSIEVNGNDIEFNFDSLFSQYHNDKLRRGEIIVGDTVYDTSVNINRALAKYKIDVEYKSYGIRSIELVPIGLYMSGEIELNSDNDSVTEDFELAFENGQLISNTLSKPINVKGVELNLSAKLPNNVKFTSERVSNFSGYYVTSVKIMDSGADFVINFEY
jgi:hypothetical protein